MADLEVIGAEVVPLLDLLDRAMETFGNSTERVALLDDVDRAATLRIRAIIQALLGHIDDRLLLDDERVGLVGKDRILILDIGIDVLNREDEGVILATREHILDISGIEATELGEGQAEHLARLAEVLAAVGMDTIDEQRHHDLLMLETIIIPDRIGTDAVEVGIGEGIISGDENRDIGARFLREPRVDSPEIAFAPTSLNSLIDVAGSTIISGKGEVPVAKKIIQGAEETAGGIRGFIRIEAFIHQAIDLKAVDACGGWHELPETGRARVGACRGIEGGLDDGEVLELERHVMLHEFILEHGEIELGEALERSDLARAAEDVHLNETADDVVVRHRDLIGERLEARYIEGIGEGGGVVLEGAGGGVEPSEGPIEEAGVEGEGEGTRANARGTVTGSDDIALRLHDGIRGRGAQGEGRERQEGDEEYVRAERHFY